MRVLHINCNYLGSALHQEMIEKLDLLGVENIVFVPTYNGSIINVEPNNNVYVSNCFNYIDRLFYYVKQEKIIKSIENAFDVSDFDLIHAYTLFTDGNCAQKLSKKYNVPYVVAVRNTDVNVFFRTKPYLKRRGVNILAGSSKIFFLSEAYRNTVFRKYIPDSMQYNLYEKSLIMPNGIDDYWLDNINTKKTMSDKELRLVYAGAINKNKNILGIIAAMNILIEVGFNPVLYVAGKVLDKAVYNAIINNERVKYCGCLSKPELQSLFRNNDIFVMPSFHESFGLVYVEAMSQGLPVIYSKGQGFDGHFSDGTIGFAVDPTSPEDIATSIEKIIGNYEVMSNNCVNSCLSFRWDTIVAKYYDLYNCIV